MSLRDRLPWGRRDASGDEPDADPAGDNGAASGGRDTGAARAGVAAAGRPEISDFDPHSNGDYHCLERGLYLRFARPVVTESTAVGPGTGAFPARAGGDGDVTGSARGEFTAAGRFTVQRPFGRAVVYTVLEVRSRYPVHAHALRVRRTDTSTGSSEELEFVFEPDDTDAAAVPPR